MPYKVDHAFSTAHLTMESELSRKRKFVKHVEHMLVVSEASRRQSAWLQREVHSIDDEAWRPLKAHRTAAHGWLIRTEHQLKYSTAYKGWSRFQFREGAAEWQPSLSWPGMSVCIDIGSVGLGAASARMYKFGMSIRMYADFSHMDKRAFEGAMKMVGL
jgi:hypothetical protein